METFLCEYVRRRFPLQEKERTIIQMNRLKPNSSISTDVEGKGEDCYTFSKELRLWDSFDLLVMKLFIPGESNKDTTKGVVSSLYKAFPAL